MANYYSKLAVVYYNHQNLKHQNPPNFEITAK